MRQLKITTQITNRDSQAVEKYLQEISKEGMITPEEEVQLAIRIHQGDQKACEKLVRANLRFVVSVAKQYQHQGLALSELINEGNCGLIKAAWRYDETRGFKFISYAVWWIRQSILQAIAEHGRMVRLPLNRIGTYHKVNKAVTVFEQENEREPSIEELAEILDLSEDDIKSIFIENSRHVSLDAPVNDGVDDTMADFLEGDDDPESVLKIESLSQDVEKILSCLTERERCVLYAFFGLKAISLRDVEKLYDLTTERVRQIKEKAIKKLRVKGRPILKGYLG